MTLLVKLGLVVLDMHAVWASLAMTVSKQSEYHLARNDRAANKEVEKVSRTIPCLKAEMGRLRRASRFATLDTLQGYW